MITSGSLPPFFFSEYNSCRESQGIVSQLVPSVMAIIKGSFKATAVLQIVMALPLAGVRNLPSDSPAQAL